MDLEKIKQFNEENSRKSESDGNHQQVLQGLHDLLLATVVSKDPRMAEVATNLGDFLGQIAQATKDFKGSALHKLPLANQELADSVKQLTSKLDDLAPHDMAPFFQSLETKLETLKTEPTSGEPINLTPLIDAVKSIKQADVKIPKFDSSAIVNGLSEVADIIKNQQFPVPNYLLPFQNNGKAQQANVDSSGNQVSAIKDSLSQSISAFPATFLRVSDEPRQVFYDPFEGAIDSTNRWTVTSGNSGVAATNTTGVMTMGTGVVANGYSKLTSQPSFTLPIPGWLGVSDATAIPDAAAPLANSYIYFGTGTTPGTPSVATPVTDGYGFERNTDGKLRAVVYAGTTRTVIADLSAATGTGTQPVDANYHRYIIYIRTDRAYWYIDGITSAQLVATSNFQSSQVQTLPRLLLTIGNSTPPVSNVTLLCTGATAWDTGKNATQIADGTFPWRKAQISATGGLNTQEQPQSVSTGALSNATSTAYEASRVIKSTPGRLYRLTGYNSLASAQFIQLHNATSLPADTAVPVMVMTVGASSNFSIDLGVYGRYFSTGIVVTNSTTGPTKTIGVANVFFDAGYL